MGHKDHFNGLSAGDLKTPPDLQMEPAPLYNGERPFVLVDIYNDDPSRGDTHGYIGLAKRVAAKTGGDFLFIDKETLEGLAPEIPLEREETYKAPQRDLRLKKLFDKRGYPDFVFSRYFSGPMQRHLSEHAAGIMVATINECIPGSLQSRDADACLTECSPEVVPHHLSPEVLKQEGDKFAQEFSELPRPFIGVNLADLFEPEVNTLLTHLSGLKDAYDRATFFICSYRRTCDRHHSMLLEKLRDSFSGCEGRFPVIDFDYNLHARKDDPKSFWNPYAGLVAQADHLIVTSGSHSMTSEALARGYAVHVTNIRGWYAPEIRKGYLKPLESCKTGEALHSPACPPLDLTDEFADALVRRHRIYKENLVRSGKASGFLVID